MFSFSFFFVFVFFFFEKKKKEFSSLFSPRFTSLVLCQTLASVQMPHTFILYMYMFLCGSKAPPITFIHMCVLLCIHISFCLPFIPHMCVWDVKFIQATLETAIKRTCNNGCQVGYHLHLSSSIPISRELFPFLQFELTAVDGMST